VVPSRLIKCDSSECCLEGGDSMESKCKAWGNFKVMSAIKSGLSHFLQTTKDRRIRNVAGNVKMWWVSKKCNITIVSCKLCIHVTACK